MYKTTLVHKLDDEHWKVNGISALKGLHYLTKFYTI